MLASLRTSPESSPQRWALLSLLVAFPALVVWAVLLIAGVPAAPVPFLLAPLEWVWEALVSSVTFWVGVVAGLGG